MSIWCPYGVHEHSKPNLFSMQSGLRGYPETELAKTPDCIGQLAHPSRGKECATMSKEKPARKPYPSDLTDAQWTILAPLIPAAHTQHGGRPRRGGHAGSGEYALVSESERVSRGYAAARLTAQEHRVRLLCAVARRWHVGQAAGRPCANRPAGTRVGSPPPVPRASIANRSRRRRWAVASAAMMAARRSKGASGICWSIRWAC